ncbi:MAG: DUF4397 domain-containing protein [Chitinophagaceae bacterium]|nr:DUF4397 domain-containing protein [Chitinophagaceae bacterium]
MLKIKSVFPVLGMALVLATGSCIKKDPLARISQVLLVPLSPDAGAVDFSINDQLVATTVNYPSAAGTATYSLPYYTITPGNTSVKYNITGSPVTYAEITSSIEDDNAYSTFLIDSISRIKAVIVKDNVTAPPEGKVKLRFFHFSPNAPAMDVTRGATGPALFTNRAFNDQGNAAFQEFIVVDPGLTTFVFKTTGTSTVLYTTASLNLLPDRVYTLAARGVVGGAGAKALGALWYANRP